MIAGVSSDARAEFTVEARRTQKAIRIDGVLDPEEWKGAATLDGFIQFEPYRGEPAQEKTEGYILYDDRYVYFGFRSFDSQPSRIAAQLTQRDSGLCLISGCRDLFSDDSVFVVIDTFHDSRSAYYFITNPLGTQTDGRIGENGKVVETNWDAPWKSAAARFDGGWTAEIAIPFAALRFPAGNNKTWGFNVGRTCRRLLETSFWAGPLEERFKVSQYGELRGLNLESAQRRYEVIPYVLGQVQQGRASQGAMGADLRYAVTPESIVNLTVNPDFATIEADQEEINLTRFEVNLPEKRQFFLEGSEQYGQRIQTFYSRRIADIQAGGKFLGKARGWQYSALTAQSDPIPVSPGNASRRSANYSVLRLQKDLFGSSTVALLTANRALGGINSGSIGVDTTLFFTKASGFTGQLVRSHGLEKHGRWWYFVRPFRDTATSHIHFRYTHLGDKFGDNVNAIGFIPDDNRREMDSNTQKRFFPRRSPIERIEYRANYNIYWGQTGTLRSWKINETISTEFRNRWSAGLSHISEFKLFEKKFRNYQNGMNFGYNTREYQSFSANFESGHNFDSDFKLLGGQIHRKLSNALSVEYELSRLWLDPDPQGSSTTIHVIRANQSFTRDLFVRLFFQTNSAIDRRNLQAIFVWRYKPPFGTLQFAWQRGTAAFGERSSQPNTLFLKFAYVL